MADLSLRAESVPVTLPDDLIPIKLPPVLAYIVGADIAPRRSVEQLIQKAIDALDELDGDPDLGPDGDELDGTGAEDDFCSQGDGSFAPGCPLSDPGEDDDPSGQCDEDGMNVGLGYHDRLPDGLNYLKTLPIYKTDQSLGPINSQAAYRDHMRRECELA